MPKCTQLRPFDSEVKPYQAESMDARHCHAEEKVAGPAGGRGPQAAGTQEGELFPKSFLDEGSCAELGLEWWQTHPHLTADA